jgi:hypothetical protein
VRAQKAELRVALTNLGPAAAPAPQTLALTIQPTGINAEDVDHIPAQVAGFERPHTYVLSIGVSAYRDAQLPPRKYASSDAEMVARYFQSLGGVPPANIRLLRDGKALKPDIDEALLDWLPAHMNPDAMVIVYFAGQALVNQKGDVFLVPYEGSAASSAKLYPLKELESALSRLKAKQTILLFDGLVSKLQHDPKAKSVLPKWDQVGGTSIRLISGEGLTKGLEDDAHRHGLFTYYLLRALRGEADTNRDGDVTLEEVAGYVSQKVSWASKAQLKADQHPQIIPALKSRQKTAPILLTKVSSIAGVQSPSP